MNEKQRIADLMEAWAPPHARELLADGWRLSDGDGLNWVRNDKPSLFLPDAQARALRQDREGTRRALMSAGDYRDSDACDRLEAELEALPTYEQLGARYIRCEHSESYARGGRCSHCGAKPGCEHSESYARGGRCSRCGAR